VLEFFTLCTSLLLFCQVEGVAADLTRVVSFIVIDAVLKRTAAATTAKYRKDFKHILYSMEHHIHEWVDEVQRISVTAPCITLSRTVHLVLVLRHFAIFHCCVIFLRNLRKRG
jgi:hypothetical protein